MHGRTARTRCAPTRAWTHGRVAPPLRPVGRAPQVECLRIGRAPFLQLLGAVHEDEMTFVMGQPIFMFDGSCCGVYGAHTGSSEACAAKRECTACFAPHRFGSAGYQPYFNEKELAFSELVGRFWTNFASSQDPNVRHDFDAASGRLVDASQEDAHWPDVSTGKNIVLDADLDGHAAAEGTLYGDDRVCALWAKIDAAPAAVEQA